MSRSAWNGLKKIVLVNAHGGNNGLVAMFNMLQLLTPRDYVVYVAGSFGFVSAEDLPWDDADDNHAGPSETSMMLALRPELVHMDRVPADDEGKARDRLHSLNEVGVRTGIWWYADYPTHYAGNAAPATAEAGEKILDTIAEAIARAGAGDQGRHRSQAVAGRILRRVCLAALTVQVCGFRITSGLSFQARAGMTSRARTPRLSLARSLSHSPNTVTRHTNYWRFPPHTRVESLTIRT